MRNRYGDEYYWEKLSDNEYKFVMEGDSMKYCRMGGKEGQEGIDPNDLRMFDPSGGPYIEIGSLVEGCVVKHIRSVDKSFVVTVK